MSNDSTTRGYLTPLGQQPNDDQEIERLISQWICGLTGLDTLLVYPRWTNPQPEIPKNGITWCEFGITSVRQDFHPVAVDVDADTDAYWQQESITLVVCFCGPAGLTTAMQFRDGIYVSQNNHQLNIAGMSLEESGNIVAAPELIDDQWLRRYDINVTLRRKTIRDYGIKSLASVPVNFFGE